MARGPRRDRTIDCRGHAGGKEDRSCYRAGPLDGCSAPVLDPLAGEFVLWLPGVVVVPLP
jgi:hypothetical protein